MGSILFVQTGRPNTVLRQIYVTMQSAISNLKEVESLPNVFAVHHDHHDHTRANFARIKEK